MRAKDAMTSPAITVTSEMHCKDAAALMLRHRIIALPVVGASGRLVGLVSEADLLPLEATPDLGRRRRRSRAGSIRCLARLRR